MALQLARLPVNLSAGQSSRWPNARWSSRVRGVVLHGAVYAAYVAVAAALLAHLVAGIAEIQSPGAGMAEPPGASGAPVMLTITVTGPIGPLKLYCATTTDRVRWDQVNVAAAEVVHFYEVNVSAAEVVQFVQQVCDRVPPD